MRIIILIVLAKYPANSMINDVDQLKCANTYPVSSTDDQRYVPYSAYISRV